MLTRFKICSNKLYIALKVKVGYFAIFTWLKFEIFKKFEIKLNLKLKNGYFSRNFIFLYSIIK